MRRAEDVVARCYFKTTEGSILPAIFDFLYREFCRARLVEMRKQLFLSQTNSPESTEADGNISSLGANDRDSSVGDSQHEDDQAKLNGPKEPPAAV
jgi:hypothetical protein